MKESALDISLWYKPVAKVVQYGEPFSTRSSFYKHVEGASYCGVNSLKKKIKREQKERYNLRIDDAEIRNTESEIFDSVEDID